VCSVLVKLVCRGMGAHAGGGDGVWWPGEFEGGRFQGKWGRRWMSASV